MNRRNRKAGFILLENIIALGLSAVISASLFSIYFCACNVFEYQLTFTDVHYAERAAMQMIIEDLMAAREVEYLDEGRKLRLLIGGAHVSYYLQNQTVYRHGAAKMPVANDIGSISFQADKRPGYTIIHIGSSRNNNEKQLVCSAIPRLLVRTAGMDD